MKHRLLFLLVLFSISAQAQEWSTFLDSSRAIDWSSAGFSIPNYTVNCSTQPSLTAGTGAAAANANAITNALNSCDATHNVVNIPAGTYYVTGFTYPDHGHQVVRGAGPNSTYVFITGQAPSCNGWSFGICIGADTGVYWQNSAALAGGSNQCAWTAGYAQGSHTITLGSCGSPPPAGNFMLVLDQINDTSDTGGIYICDSSTSGCTIEASANWDGRRVNNLTRSQSQSVWVTGVVNNGNGTYTVTLDPTSPGVYFTNIRSSQSPGAWWPGVDASHGMNNGLENITFDESNSNASPIALFNCYQCWIKNVRTVRGARSHVATYDSLRGVIRDSYMYAVQTPGTSTSYGVEIEIATSQLLVENNIIQQVTDAIMFGQGSGNVIGYNFMIDAPSAGTGMNISGYLAHNAGSEMNLWEGNALNGMNSDSSTWGSSTQNTIFRNNIPGWQSGMNFATNPIKLLSWSRAYNAVGNVLGQPSYHDTYEAYASSTSNVVNWPQADTSIFFLGWTGNGVSMCGGPPPCGPLVRTSLMRWGNWDVVTNGAKWDSTEASPTAVPYVNANFTSSYFSSLAHTLPSSLYYSSIPSWWPSGKAWPPIGPDVTTGNVGMCTGTYSGVQATASSQCSGGTLTSAWASHVTSIPAQDCFLNVMNGPPNGSGGILSFDASQCYGSSGTSGGGTGPAAPTGLTATTN
jgi:hypothetical protein